MKTYVIFYKPFNVLCQFTAEKNVPCLADFDLPKNIYPVGRLDKDSEGLLLLSDDGPLIEKILNPKSMHRKSYWAQVERIPTEDDLDQMRKGLRIKDYKTRPCSARMITPPSLPSRNPPIRYRKNVQDCWLDIEIIEGKNRQVRKMTAAIGHPTLRLVRHRIGNLSLDGLRPGMWTFVKKDQITL